MRRILLILIVTGVLLRFVHLDQKHYWQDEASTSFRAAGNRTAEIAWPEYAQREHAPYEFLQRFQSARADRDISDVYWIHITEARHPPFYFMFAHLWMQIAAPTPAHMRLLSAIFGALVPLAAYLLAREMGWHRDAALLTAALASVSPFLVAYAQEARPYSLLALLTLIASILFLRALHSNRPLWWLLYALCLVIGMHTQVIFLFLIVAHAAYFFVTTVASRHPPFVQWDRRLTGLAAALAVTAASSVPLFISPDAAADRSQSWVTQTLPLIRYLRQMFLALSWPFADLKLLPAAVEVLIYLPLLVVLALSLLYLLQRSPAAQSSLLMPAIIAANTVPLLALDILHGGQRAAVARYLTPAHAAAVLAVGFFLAEHSVEPAARRRGLWQAVTVYFLVMGLVSSLILVSRPGGSRGKGNDEAQLAVLRHLNAQTQPLLLLDRRDAGSNFADLLGLCHKLDDDVRILITDSPQDLLDSEGRLFLYKPADLTLARLRGQARSELSEVVPGLLWRLANSTSTPDQVPHPYPHGDHALLLLGPKEAPQCRKKSQTLMILPGR